MLSQLEVNYQPLREGGHDFWPIVMLVLVHVGAMGCWFVASGCKETTEKASWNSIKACHSPVDLALPAKGSNKHGTTHLVAFNREPSLLSWLKNIDRPIAAFHITFVGSVESLSPATKGGAVRSCSQAKNLGKNRSAKALHFTRDKGTIEAAQVRSSTLCTTVVWGLLYGY